MTTKELALYLNVNERTVLRLVQDEVLPAVRIGNQWRFRRVAIEAWLDDQMLGVSPAREPLPGLPTEAAHVFGLEDCFDPTQVVPELEASGEMAVLAELAGLSHRLGLVRDRTWFTGALVERETILPSAIGKGVAFPHTAGRNPEQVVRPFMVLGRSTPGIDFGAPDGQPVHFFFVLGLRYQELHLPWLARLSRLMGDPKLFAAMLAASDAAELYTLLDDADRSSQVTDDR